MVVGLVANNPMVRAGCGYRPRTRLLVLFFCNVFNIPLVSLVDVPGFSQVAQEQGGIIL